MHVSINGALKNSAFSSLTGCTVHRFKGKHPAGNVGVQISHISPILKGDTVWTITLNGVAAVGRLMSSGRVDVRRKVAVCGPAALQPSYVETLPGTPVKDFAPFYGHSADEVRIISGDVLSGVSVGLNGYLGWNDDQLTIVHEGYD